MTGIARKRVVLGLFPVVLVTAFLDEYQGGWWWSGLRWSVFIVFLSFWAVMWQAWLDKRRAARRGGTPPGRQDSPSP